MIDHVTVNVSDIDRAKSFYAAALAPLGYTLLMEFEGYGAGFGRDGKPDFWIKKAAHGDGVHVALTTEDRPTVDAFHAAALGAGGKDNGGPGVREHYHPTYYGAFVHDADGNNIEAVCHTPA
jgi:catechol 2,3-dioxygenase-like lactoylglutathione lyase family enzyme